MIALTKLSETQSKITLGWAPVAGAVGYVFYADGVRKSHTWDPARSQVTFSKGPATFQVEALGRRDIGTYPPPPMTVPSVPTGLVATPGDRKITLKWNPNPASEKVTSYRVYLNDVALSVVITGTTYEALWLTNGQTYKVRVAALNSMGPSLYTDPALIVVPSAPLGTQWYVAKSGNDTTGNGSVNAPWLTVKKACDTVTSGTINVGQGTYDETATCTLAPNVSLKGTGVSLTILRCATDFATLLQIGGNTAPASVSDIGLNGQAKTKGTRGINVQTASYLTIFNVESVAFKGAAAGGGACHLDEVTSCVVRNSVFRDSGAIFEEYYTGTFGVGDATNCVFHDLTVTDSTAGAIKNDNGSLTNCEFYNITATCGDAFIVSWPAIAFEAVTMPTVGCELHHCYFNATVSLTDTGAGTPLASGWRWQIYNNHFDIPPESETGTFGYALELDMHSTEVHHNFFDGGVSPIANYYADQKTGLSFHHNIFDNQEDWIGMILFNPGMPSDTLIYNNTHLSRQDWWTALIKLDANVTNSSPQIYDNIFSGISALGDIFGPNLASAVITDNVFYNMTSRGTGAIVPGAQPLATIGGFPAAYVPSGASALKGALVDGNFVVGVQ